MAAINDLINKIDDLELRERIKAEVDKLSKQKKFGLVFENHVPECTALYDVPIHVGSKVALKDKKINDVYVVKAINDNQATCVSTQTKETTEFSLDSLVSIAEFGDEIYPYLKPIDSIENAPDSSLWHTLIEADNYHALQLLGYLYEGQVDCIYIDPPYNTGAKDWKYNNDYVDSSDAYRHSKWLSMMEKRLKLAKKLLNPSTGVLIVTIDEHEVNHLGCLLEEVFPDAYSQMVTIVINPKGSTRGRFSRVEEYAIFCFMPNAYVCGGKDSMLGDLPNEESKQPRWKGLLRSGAGARREDSPNLFYPILINESTNTIVRAEAPVPLGISPDFSAKIEGYTAAWPIRNDNTEGRWMLSAETFNSMLSKGYIQIGRYDQNRKTYGFSYLSKKFQQQIDTGELQIVGRSDNGQSVVVEFSVEQAKQVKTVWHRTSHDAGVYGSDLVSNVIGRSRAFSFPKSLYAVSDSLSMITRNKPNALILDFFAGSGTTLHAVNLLNAEDGGHRRCIMVTNNEVSDEEAKKLKKDGFKPGDSEWERLGIAYYVTWPRTVCSIKGEDINGNPLKGTYLDSERAMADGFKANAAFFKLGFLDKNAVALGRQFKELLPVLWMKTGCVGLCPKLETESLPSMLILPQNAFAVLIDEHAFPEFMTKVNAYTSIKQVFIVTNSTNGYREMSNQLKIEKSYQLYSDYLINFHINMGR